MRDGDINEGGLTREVLVDFKKDLEGEPSVQLTLLLVTFHQVLKKKKLEGVILFKMGIKRIWLDLNTELLCYLSPITCEMYLTSYIQVINSRISR